MVLSIVLSTLQSSNSLCHNFLQEAARLCQLVRVDQLLQLAQSSTLNSLPAGSRGFSAAAGGSSRLAYVLDLGRAQQQQQGHSFLSSVGWAKPPCREYCKWLSETQKPVKVPATLVASRLESADR